MCTLIKRTQQIYFAREILLLEKGKLLPKFLRKLNPFLDKNQILRVGGRIPLYGVLFDKKYPILLPRWGRLTELIIEDMYKQCALTLG